jgi:hypothetical protein
MIAGIHASMVPNVFSVNAAHQGNELLGIAAHILLLRVLANETNEPLSVPDIAGQTSSSMDTKHHCGIAMRK